MNQLSIKILIADDDKDDVEFLKEALNSIMPSATIVHVSDGIAALRYVKTSQPPDLVFLDLNMPLKNGLNCLKDIHNLKLLPDTPIIIYSTSNSIDDIDEAYKYNASFYIVKPPSFKLLCDIIKYSITLLGKYGRKRIDRTGFVLNERCLSRRDDKTLLYQKYSSRHRHIRI